MAIGNIGDRVSKRDIDRVKQIQNPPEFEPGYESNDSTLDDLQFDQLLGDGGLDNFNTSGGLDGFGTAGLDGFNSPIADIYGLNGGMNNMPQTPPKPDYYEEMFKAVAESSKTLYGILKELFGTFKNRTADDIAYVGRNSILTGFIIAVAATVIWLISKILGWEMLANLSASWIVPGALVLSYGTIFIGVAMIWLEKDPDAKRTLSDIPNIPDGENNVAGEYSSMSDDLLDSLFDDYDDSSNSSDFVYNDDDSLDDDDEISFGFEDIYSEYDKNKGSQKEESVQIVNEYSLDNVVENSIINRTTLFNTFKPMLVTNTPRFKDKEIIDAYSDEFLALQTICLKVLANVAKKEIEEINSVLELATRSLFSIELKLERVRGINKTDEIAKEMEVYLKESHDDDSVNVTVNIEGDFYKIIATTGENSIITLGDVFQQKEICDYFLNTKNKLPIIIGIDNLGRAIYDDAKLFDTMMIAGKPRAGKSWEVLSKMLSMMLFNPPSMCQFCIIDPKRSELFSTLSLMPHVIGLHDDNYVLEVMRDIIDNEGERRKKLLENNKANNIWDLRDKGIEIPMLYLVIDEVITVKSKLGSAASEFDSLMMVLISQLPYVGIRMIFIPHRATGIIDKTNRTMLQYAASVKGDNSDVCDTLDVKSWTQRLVNLGDMAVKTSNMKTPSYLKSVAVTTSDDENSKFVRIAAKAFYKMGVEVPENVCLTTAFNRDERKVRKELIGDSKVVQYTADNIYKDL